MSYTELDLRKMKGQIVKDVWHSMIGKGPGIKNTTGLKNSEEIIQAILEGQSNPAFLESFRVKAPKKLEVEPVEEEMPPKSVEKKKPGPKPKPKPKPQETKSEGACMAIETTELPYQPSEVLRMKVHKLYVNNQEYFLEKQDKKIFEVVNNRPGAFLGIWNPETKSIEH